MVDEHNDIVIRQATRDFKLRVTGVLLDATGNIAVNTAPQQDCVFLPGGKVKFGETSQTAIVREFIEEMGINVRAERLLAVTENLFSIAGKQVTEIGMTWLVTRVDETQGDARDGWEQAVIWRSLTALDDLKPVVLQPVLRDLPLQPVHLMYHQK